MFITYDHSYDHCYYNSSQCNSQVKVEHVIYFSSSEESPRSVSSQVRSVTFSFWKLHSSVIAHLDHAHIRIFSQIGMFSIFTRMWVINLAHFILSNDSFCWDRNVLPIFMIFTKYEQSISPTSFCLMTVLPAISASWVIVIFRSRPQEFSDYPRKERKKETREKEESLNHTFKFSWNGNTELLLQYATHNVPLFIFLLLHVCHTAWSHFDFDFWHYTISLYRRAFVCPPGYFIFYESS